MLPLHRVCPCIAVLLAGLVRLPAQIPAQPTAVTAFHRSGQTFITWTERAEIALEKYRVYRHTQPVTAANLAAATMLFEVPEGSARFHADRYRHAATGVWNWRYLYRYVIQDGYGPIGMDTGLLVWTLAAEDFSGATSGAGHYAVTTVDATGVENVADFGTANRAGPVSEFVADPLPVEVNPGAPTRIFVQYMDLRKWNPTFHAPRAANLWYGQAPADPGVPDAIQYAYTYVVMEPNPSNCAAVPPGPKPAYIYLHGWKNNSFGPVSGYNNNNCAWQVMPVDVMDTWWFGFARNHDYRGGNPVPAGDTVVNYTEQRVLRIVRDLARHPVLGAQIDFDRFFVYGDSMGGAGALALALRYPAVFAAAYANQPMTNYATSGAGGGTNWISDIQPKWGQLALNLPVAIEAPAGWAAHLAGWNGTGVWTWQNHQQMIPLRAADETVPFGIVHGTADTIVEWTTQGRPAYAILDASRRCFGGVVTSGAHGWQGWGGLPPALAFVGGQGPWRGLQARRSESVPGLRNAGSNPPLPPAGPGSFNHGIEWAASWDAWDLPPLDTANAWEVSLRAIGTPATTVDVTPRRCQSFVHLPYAAFRFENRRLSDGALVQSGLLLSDAAGLVTAETVQVSSGGNRLRIEAAAYGLLASPFVGGQLGVVAAFGAVPGSTQHLFVSAAGLGATPFPPAGVVLGLADAFELAALPASSGGLAIWPIPVPPGFAGLPVWFQAAEPSATTPVVPVILN